MADQHRPASTSRQPPLQICWSFLPLPRGAEAPVPGCFRPQSPLCAPPPSFQEAACLSSRAPRWDGTSGSAGKDHCTLSLSLTERPHPTPSVTIGQYNLVEGWVGRCLSFTCEDATPPCCLTRCGLCWLKRQDIQLSGGIRLGLPWNEVSCRRARPLRSSHPLHFSAQI